MFRTKSVFEKTLDKATSNLLLEPDLDTMLQLCDMIRGGDVRTRDAANLIRNRVLDEKNPNQKLLAVNVLDTVMKNCGESFHSEMITDAFLEKLKDLVKNARSDVLKTKLLEMVQCWGVAFKGTKLKSAFNLYNILKAEGYSFPAEKCASELFKSESAPIWQEGRECQSCKIEFGVVTRKHHCRACGGIFCNKCTTKQAIIPKFGIEKEVRVCDKCYAELTSKRGRGGAGTSAKTSTSNTDSDLPIEYLQSALFKETQEPPKKTDAEIKEEEELQLAMALSLDEQQNRAQIQRERNSPVNVKSSPVGSPRDNGVAPDDTDPDLAHYFNRAYWEKKKEKQDQQQQHAQTNGRSSPAVTVQNNSVPKAQVVNEVLVTTSESDRKFLNSMRTSVDIFLNRMRSNKIRGRSISNDSAVQTLFQSINSNHAKVLNMLNDLEDTRLHEEALQDKLTQMKDARAALDALRADHQEKLRREAEEAERLRQIQMVQKLQLMRQKKQEFLAHQRQQALQRVQEQEAARKAMFEQRKQQMQQKAMQNQMGYMGPPPVTNYGGGAYYGAPQDMQQAGYMPNQYQQQQGAYMQQGGYYQDGGQQPSQMMPQQGNYQQPPPPQDYYNMQGMQGALPQQQQPPPQVANSGLMASAPPQTPQPTPPQSIDGSHPQVYQQMPPGHQQQVYQHQDQQQQQPSVPDASAQPPPQGQTDQQNLLISFD